MAGELFPAFRYFRDPVGEEAIQRYDGPCDCCDAVRGYIVSPPYYGEEKPEALCPWCVASGDAGRRFGIFFNDATELREAEVDEEIVIEIEQQTPGIQTWQEWPWPAHCRDAAVFIGEIDGPGFLDGLTDDQIAECVAGVQAYLPGFTGEDLRALKRGGQPAVYVFQCRRCGRILPIADYT